MVVVVDSVGGGVGVGNGGGGNGGGGGGGGGGVGVVDFVPVTASSDISIIDD